MDITYDAGKGPGKQLYIDCGVQSSEHNEAVYHESLVHPALVGHQQGAAKVFIAGGGEGGTAREVCRCAVAVALSVVQSNHILVTSSVADPQTHKCAAVADGGFGRVCSEHVAVVHTLLEPIQSL